jgi:hypothetical protein
MGAVAASGQQLGAVCSGRPGRVPLTRSVDGATVGRALAAVRNPAEGQALASRPLESRHAAHHPCLGLDLDPPYAAPRGNQSVTRPALEELKQQIPLLEYLQARDWQPARPLTRG